MTYWTRLLALANVALWLPLAVGIGARLIVFRPPRQKSAGVPAAAAMTSDDAGEWVGPEPPAFPERLDDEPGKSDEIPNRGPRPEAI